MMVPSRGIRSPALTTMVSPICTSSGSTCSMPPLRDYVGGIRPDIHQAADGTAGLIDRIALEPFADLIEQHDGDTFRVFV